MPSFTDKVVFMTGAAGAIGRATAELLADRGATLFLTDLREPPVPAGSVSFSRSLDVTRSSDVAAAMRDCAERFGGIDVLVANAGVFPRRAFAEIGDEEWRTTFSINVDGVFYCCREAIPHMRPGASIVALASIAGHRGSRDHAHYAATKGAVLSLVRSLAWELAPDIRANCVSPGPVDSPMAGELMEHRGTAIIRQTPLGRIATPEEVARTVAFLASDWATHITGTAIHVNGGSYIAG